MRKRALSFTGMIVLCWMTFALSGCSAIMGTEPKEFVNSSADINGGVVHMATVTGVPLPELMLKINDLAAKRGLVVVNKFDCTKTACKLTYKSIGQNRSMNYATTRTTTTGHYPYYDPLTDTYSPFPPATTTHHTVKTANLSYFSRYFIALTTRGSVINIEMVGVPVLNQKMSCPTTLLAPFVTCAVPIVEGERDVSLADSFKREWGYDISGIVEADVIGGIFAELSMIVDASPDAPRNTTPLSDADKTPNIQNRDTVDTDTPNDGDTDSVDRE